MLSAKTKKNTLLTIVPLEALSILMPSGRGGNKGNGNFPVTEGTASVVLYPLVSGDKEIKPTGLQMGCHPPAHP